MCSGIIWILSAGTAELVAMRLSRDAGMSLLRTSLQKIAVENGNSESQEDWRLLPRETLVASSATVPKDQANHY